MKSVLSTAILALALLAVPMSAQELSWMTEAEDSKAGQRGQSTTIEMETLSRVEASPGNYVIWLYDADADLIQIGVSATFPNKPLVGTEFIQNHDPIEVFLAVADLDEEVPDLLASRAPREALQKAFGAREREILKIVNERELSRLQNFEESASKGSGQSGGCNPQFQSWAGGAFGSGSCGDPSANALTWETTSETYCNEEATGGACDHDLGIDDRGACVPQLGWCFRVKGETTYRKQRIAEFQGNVYLIADGHWAKYGAANCVGDGDFQFHLQRGNQTFSAAVPVNSMKIYILGSWDVPARANWEVNYGYWTDGIPANGSTYKLNKTWLAGNGAAGDRAIICGDVRNRHEMEEVPSACYGGAITLCTELANCDSACYSCPGGGCG